ncbi:hypothetical protein ACJX0J_016946, partial [Zea mays]
REHEREPLQWWTPAADSILLRAAAADVFFYVKMVFYFLLSWVPPLAIYVNLVSLSFLHGGRLVTMQHTGVFFLNTSELVAGLSVFFWGFLVSEIDWKYLSRFITSPDPTHVGAFFVET